MPSAAMADESPISFLVDGGNAFRFRHDWKAGNDFGSLTAICGDIGTPGSYRYPGCTPVEDDTLFRDGFEAEPRGR